MGTRATPLFAATILIVASTSCGDTSVTRFETLKKLVGKGYSIVAGCPTCFQLQQAHSLRRTTSTPMPGVPMASLRRPVLRL
jgi:hypothetical protein